MSDLTNPEAAANDLVVYAKYGSTHGAEIVGAEFMGGQFVIPGSETLSFPETNAVALVSLGYTAAQALELFGIPKKLHTQNLRRVRDKFATRLAPAPVLLSACFKRGNFVTSRLAVPPPAALDPRQQEAWDSLARGESPVETGKRVFLSDTTIKLHRKNLYKVLDTINVNEAAVYHHLRNEQFLDECLVIDEAACTARGFRRFVMPHATN